MSNVPEPISSPKRGVRAKRTRFGRDAARRGRAQSGYVRSAPTVGSSTDHSLLTDTRGSTSSRLGNQGAAAIPFLRTRLAIRKASRWLGTVGGVAWEWASSTVTGLGLTVMIAVLLAFVAGYGFGWLELIAVAWAGLALVLIAVCFMIGRNNYDIGLTVDTQRVVVGMRVAAELIIRNPTRFRLLPVKAEVPVGAGLAEFYLPGIKPRGEISEDFIVPTSRRGVIQLGPVRTIRADPVGLLRREYEWTNELELFVHPATVSIPSTSMGLIRDLEGNPTRDLTQSDISFHALRPYAPGDERRHIHWKSTAKTGDLMVRQFEETRRSQLVIALSVAEADYHSEDEFELAVSVAGSLGIRAIRDGRDLAVVASEETPEFAQRAVRSLKRLSSMSPTRLLDDLARIEHSPAAYRSDILARITAELVTGISLAFIICGSEPTPTELRATSTQFPPGVEVIAVVCEPGVQPGLRRVGELSILRVGYLDDLQKSLARAAR